MAYIGLADIYVAKLTSEKDKTYSDGFKVGRAISANITPAYNEAGLYADNQLVEQVKEFKNAAVSLGVDRVDVAAASVMFGHAVDGENVTYKTSDSANYVGVGMCTSELLDGVKKYVTTIIYKAKFTEASNEFSTKGDTIEFKTPTIEGTALGLSTEEWKETMVFATEAEALAHIKEALCIEDEDEDE